jgi:hypothetical protein
MMLIIIVREVRRMKGLSVFLLGAACGLSFLIGSGGWSPGHAKETMEVVRDKDKTVYSIDSDDSARREEDRDKERAWQMLQNGNFWIDGRGRRQGPAPQGSQQPSGR